MANATQPVLRRRTRTGLVTSDRMQKTIVVRVDSLNRHHAYGRVQRHAVSYKAHDERQEAHIGDLVRIMETRPLSKDKRWRLVEVLKRAPQSVAELADPLAADSTEAPSA